MKIKTTYIDKSIEPNVTITPKLVREQLMNLGITEIEAKRLTNIHACFILYHKIKRISEGRGQTIDLFDRHIFDSKTVQDLYKLYIVHED